MMVAYRINKTRFAGLKSMLDARLLTPPFECFVYGDYYAQ